jgi:hypothetical protein
LNGNEPKACIKRAGHCTRCEEPFGGNRAMAYMVREYVVWNTQYAIGALCQWEIAPVCAACVKPAEEAAADLVERACEGCGLVLRSRSVVTTCSNRCTVRARRARRRNSRPKHDCIVCGLSFKPKRNSGYCSAACKQKAYRQRRPVPAQIETGPTAACGAHYDRA